MIIYLIIAERKKNLSTNNFVSGETVSKVKEKLRHHKINKN